VRSDVRMPLKARTIMRMAGTRPMKTQGMLTPNCCWKVVCRNAPIRPISIGASSAYAMNMSPPVTNPERGPRPRVTNV